MNTTSLPVAPVATAPAPSAGDILARIEIVRVNLARLTNTLIATPTLVDDYDVAYLAGIAYELTTAFEGYTERIGTK